MTRLLTVTTIAICGLVLALNEGFAQSNPEPAGQSRQLTTTPRDDPPPAAPAVAPTPAAPPIAPPATAPLAAAVPNALLCDGGTVNGNACVCPAGYALLPATTSTGGTCVRTNAENCRGGVLTVGGICLCDGRVTMSGETYALEFLAGKCVPKRCPDKSYLKDGKCVASNDTRSFTCRTGYIPDDHIASATTDGMRCLPDPTFCSAESKRKDGSCPRISAIAIACFEGRCTCGPNADWVNYLCQCTPPYRNVNGICVTASAATSGEKSKPELQSTDQASTRKACPRGSVRNRSGDCVVARPRLPSAGELGIHYERAYRYRDFQGQDPMRR